MFMPPLDQILSPIEATPHTVEEVYLNGLVDGGDSDEQPLAMVYVYHRNSEIIALQEAYKTRTGVRFYRATVWHSEYLPQEMKHKDRFLTVLLRGDAIVSVEQ